MDTHWERTCPYYRLDKRTATQIMKRLTEHNAVETLELLTDGKRNTNYKVTMTNGKRPYLLRIYCNADDIWRNEFAIYHALKETLPLPEIYDSDYNSSLLDRPFAIVEYIPGQTLAQVVADTHNFSNPALFAALGERLACLHQTHYDRVGFLDHRLEVTQPLPPLQTWYQMFLSEQTERKLGQRRVQTIQRIVETMTPVFEEMEQAIRLVHGDFRPTNILVNDNGTYTIIDWEFCMAGHPIADIGQFLRYKEQVSPEHEQRFIESYQRASSYQLPPDYNTIARLRDLVNLLQMLTIKEKLPYKDHDLTRLIDTTLNMFKHINR